MYLPKKRTVQDSAFFMDFDHLETPNQRTAAFFGFIYILHLREDELKII